MVFNIQWKTSVTFKDCKRSFSLLSNPLAIINPRWGGHCRPNRISLPQGQNNRFVSHCGDIWYYIIYWYTYRHPNTLLCHVYKMAEYISIQIILLILVSHANKNPIAYGLNVPAHFVLLSSKLSHFGMEDPEGSDPRCSPVWSLIPHCSQFMLLNSHRVKPRKSKARQAVWWIMCSNPRVDDVMAWIRSLQPYCQYHHVALSCPIHSDSAPVMPCL